MQKVIKIWVLSLVTIVFIYLAFTNRYIIFPQTNIKYDRWTQEQSPITEHTKPLDSDRKMIESLIKVKEFLNQSDESKLKQLAPDWTDVLFKDSSDIKIDSLFREAIHLNRQLENSKMIQRLCELISQMQKNVRK
jgi:hypothetical protein